VAEAQLKGSAYHSTLAFVEEEFGADAKRWVLARLSEEDRALIGGIMLPIQPRLLRAMEAELGRGDLSLVIPSWLIEKGMRLWPTFHTSGEWEVSRAGERAARAELRDLGVVDEAMCATLEGWLIGLLTLAGAKRSAVDHVARAAPPRASTGSTGARAPARRRAPRSGCRGGSRST
jgi:hypothetical protein